MYIKFYLYEFKDSYPLTIGKTGTNLVNSSGVDINFETNKNVGSNQFLRDNNYTWDKSRILCKGFKTEKEACEFESKLLKETNLFG